MSKGVYEIPEQVVEDTLRYRHEVDKFLRGDTSPVAFRAIRVPMGVYEQRENGTYMVRVRGAAGVFLPHQVKLIAELAQNLGDGVVHITTRQDLQIHRVHIQDTPTLLESLLDVGLSSRGGGGNTVRNISTCPRAGICTSEKFDVTPYAVALTEYLLRERSNFNLPRKFKIAFSGCGNDCGLSSVADLGFFAHARGGQLGFSVYAGGGMGARSSLAVLLEKFVPADAVFRVAEAVKRVFDKHGDRTNRHKARLRFVVERVGEDEFRRLYRQELEAVTDVLAPEIRESPVPTSSRALSAPEPEPDSDPDYTAWQAHYVCAQKQECLFCIRVPLRFGNIASNDLAGIADIAAEAGGGIRTTQDQDILLHSIHASYLTRTYAALRGMDAYFTTIRPVRCVACAGASTCRLGLCLSRSLAGEIEQELAEVGAGIDAPIRISGCPNSCGQHPIAPIGMFGGAARVNGRLLPVYTIVAGGRVGEWSARLATPVGTVPARSVPILLREFMQAANKQRRGGESFDSLLERWGVEHLRVLCRERKKAPSYEEAPDFYRDFGSSEDFSLAGRGPGECGAGVMDVIALDIDAAKHAMEDGRLYDAVLSAARALLVTRGLEPKSDRAVFSAFSEQIIAGGWVVPETQRLLDSALDYRLGDRDTLEDLRGEVQRLVHRVEQLFLSLDSNLNFRLQRVQQDPSPKQTSEKGLEKPEDSYELDLRGVACPMNFVHAKIRLEQLNIGKTLEILLDEGEPARNVPASFAEQGQEVLSVTREAGYFRVKVRRSH